MLGAFLSSEEIKLRETPEKLKGYEKIYLKAGESKTVRFRITPEMLKFYNYNIEYVYEPGEFDVMVGCNSRDVQTKRFTLR